MTQLSPSCSAFFPKMQHGQKQVMMPAKSNNYVKIHVESIIENEHCAISFELQYYAPTHTKKKCLQVEQSSKQEHNPLLQSFDMLLLWCVSQYENSRKPNSDPSSESERNGVVHLQDRRPDPRSRAAPPTRPIFAPEHTQRANDMSTIQAGPNTPEVLFFFLALSKRVWWSGRSSRARGRNCLIVDDTQYVQMDSLGRAERARSDLIQGSQCRDVMAKSMAHVPCQISNCMGFSGRGGSIVQYSSVLYVINYFQVWVENPSKLPRGQAPT